MARNDAVRLRKHLAARGFKFGLSPAKLEQGLRRLMGRERYTQYLDICDAISAGEASPENRYRVPRTAEEANLLMSHQADVALAAAVELYGAIEQCLTQGATVLDLGCWTGALTSFIAAEHPDVQCCGVDGVLSVIACAQEQGSGPNLRYCYWNYAAAPLEHVPRGDVLVSAFGIDFEHPTSHTAGGGWPLDIADVRESPLYRYRHEEALRYLVNWRMAANPAAHLAVVLRIGDVYHALAVLDAAVAAGWCWKQQQSSFVTVGEERFPCFVFVEDLSASVDIDQVLGWWGAQEVVKAFSVLVTGAAAWVRRRALGQREGIGVHTHRYDDGTEQRIEIGRVNDQRWYWLLTATNGAVQFGELSNEDLRCGLVALPDELYHTVMNHVVADIAPLLKSTSNERSSDHTANSAGGGHR